MATSGKKPVKGILKNSSSFDKAEPTSPTPKDVERGKSTQWDEMNIIATLHPADKDYGHMKIEEPKTPYSNYKDPEDEGGERRRSIECISDTDDKETLDTDSVLKRLQEKKDVRVPPQRDEEEEDMDDDDNDDLTPEEKEHRKAFRDKRKIHYNEFYAKQLAKQLMEQDDDDDDDDEK
ncbi:protein phosphatase inhibitor 2-like isoform X2 [Lineus longissimus]|uniref:protein phosphatase inhibitor 2-like isoform X2 n=1 Tax=Lineus longissimus TaxID=88925 RepID=UPI002B4D03EF